MKLLTNVEGNRNGKEEHPHALAVKKGESSTQHNRLVDAITLQRR
jgi:hypothetical protein